ncbi:13906_t:CDS:2 [Entrophospora sp. SA101]|nr:13906_t:CDS:2 [Entrophospora sp. SA101]
MTYTKDKIKEIEQLLENDERVKVAGVDVDGILRGKILTKNKFLSTLDDGFGFCSVIFGWDMHDRAYSEELSISNSNNGYGDILAKVDLSTFRRIPWENNIAFFLLSYYDPVTKKPLYVCPRSLLNKFIKEYEYLEDPNSLAKKNYVSPTPLTQGMFGYSLLRPTSNQSYFYDIFDELKAFGVSLEGLHTETGPGVYEAAISYSTAMNMADSATLFKSATKQIGILKYGIMPCFMAKPYDNLPGCSGHLHFSLLNIETSKNVFAKSFGSSDCEQNQESQELKWQDAKEMSDEMKYFLAGVLIGLPIENYWAPINVSWGLENRTAAVRVITPPISSPSSTRIELRVPGADINPYFAIAATLACGLYGIKNKLPIPIPPESDLSTTNKVDGKAVDGEILRSRKLARSLKEATDKMMEKNSIARKVLGDEFVDHFGKTRLHEWRLWENSVTNWETKRYFELV